jgi:hypothetical protein
MTAPILSAATFCICVTTVHLASIAIAIGRFRRRARRGPLEAHNPAVSLVRPLCGLDNYAAETLASTFAQKPSGRQPIGGEATSPVAGLQLASRRWI